MQKYDPMFNFPTEARLHCCRSAAGAAALVSFCPSMHTVCAGCKYFGMLGLFFTCVRCTVILFVG